MKHKLFLKLVTIVLMFYASSFNAQTVSGLVKSTFGEVVSGANVSAKNGNYTITDEQGFFTINVKGVKSISIEGSEIIGGEFDIEGKFKHSTHIVVAITVRHRYYSGMNERKTGMETIGVIPEFNPWPPPKTSSKYVIRKKVFKNYATLGEVNEALIAALDDNGYEDKSYYSVPASSPDISGFALATRLEQIDDKGISKKDPNRWNTNHLKNELSFSEYIKALFFTSPGHFRVIVFVITDIGFNTPGSSPSRDAAISWIGQGYNVLPKRISDQVYDDRFSVTALIYEYELQKNSENAHLVANFSGKEHLKKTKIWNSLTQD